MAYETYNIPLFCLADRARCAMYGTGYENGVVVNIGADVGSVTPIYGSYPIRMARRESEIAGWKLTRFIRDNLDPPPPDEVEDHIIGDLKEKLCRVSMDCDQELCSGVPKLPYSNQ